MTKLIVDSEDLIDVADTIRTKGGTSETLEWPDDFVDAIGEISGSGGNSGSTTHVITNLANPSPRAFDYNQMAFVYSASPQFETGTPVIISAESAYSTFTILQAGTSIAVPSTTLSSTTSYGTQKVFIMPDCDVTINLQAATPIK